MEGRVIGILFLGLSASFIPDLHRFLIVWAFFIPGVIAGVLAYRQYRYWNVIALGVCFAYLLHQLPSLILMVAQFAPTSFLENGHGKYVPKRC